MRQITIRQLDRQGNVAKIKEWMPFELVSDGEVIAMVTAPDVDRQSEGEAVEAKQADRQRPRTSTKTDKLSELPLSKSRQAKGRLSEK